MRTLWMQLPLGLELHWDLSLSFWPLAVRALSSGAGQGKVAPLSSFLNSALTPGRLEVRVCPVRHCPAWHHFLDLILSPGTPAAPLSFSLESSLSCLSDCVRINIDRFSGALRCLLCWFPFQQHPYLEQPPPLGSSPSAELPSTCSTPSPAVVYIQPAGEFPQGGMCSAVALPGQALPSERCPGRPYVPLCWGGGSVAPPLAAWDSCGLSDPQFPSQDLLP